MNIYTIYKVTNIQNGKVYIGFTSNKVTHRIAEHKCAAFTNNSNRKFHRALRKYGFDSFIFETIYVAKESVSVNESHTLLVMEDYFIKQYNSIKNGYNIANGGGKFPILSGEQNPMYNKKHKAESIELMRKNRGDLSGQNNPMYGVKRTEEWLEKHVRGKNHPMFGKKHKEESLALIRGEDMICEYCGKKANRGNYYRWHGNKCKSRNS